MLTALMKPSGHLLLSAAQRKRLALGSRQRPTRPKRLPYPVFIAYSDIVAARDTVARLNKLVRTQHDDCELLPMLWRFEQLDQPRWREMALREASRAITLVLALGANATLTQGVEAWLTALTARQRGATISAAVFVGEETWTVSLQQTRVHAGTTSTSVVSAPEAPAVAALPPRPMLAARAA